MIMWVKSGNTKDVYIDRMYRLAYPKIYRCKGKVCFCQKYRQSAKDAIPFDTYGANYALWGRLHL